MCMCFFLVHQFPFCPSLFGCFPNNSSDANEWFGVQFKFSFNITKILIFILVKSTSCAFYALCLVGTFYAGCHLFLRLSNVHVRQAETLRSYSRTCLATTLCSDSTQLNAGGVHFHPQYSRNFLRWWCWNLAGWLFCNNISLYLYLCARLF